MKRIDLVRHLEEFGCEFVREGKQHTLYINRRNEKIHGGAPTSRDSHRNG